MRDAWLVARVSRPVRRAVRSDPETVGPRRIVRDDRSRRATEPHLVRLERVAPGTLAVRMEVVDEQGVADGSPAGALDGEANGQRPVLEGGAQIRDVAVVARLVSRRVPSVIDGVLDRLLG